MLAAVAAAEVRRHLVAAEGKITAERGEPRGVMSMMGRPSGCQKGGLMTPGENFVRALVAKDAHGLKELLSPDVDFKALTPGRFWESDSVDQIVDDTILGAWFEPSDEIEAVDSVETSKVGDRHRVAYRLRVRNPDGRFVVEQQAYYDVAEDMISWLRILCAGYQPVT
jgi:hypothetical protein